MRALGTGAVGVGMGGTGAVEIGGGRSVRGRGVAREVGGAKIMTGWVERGRGSGKGQGKPGG
jgi:hypothetical protein